MALATLSVDLVARLAKFEGDMGKAARATEKTSQQIVSSLGAVKAVMGGLAAGVTFAGIIELGRASINSVDALNDLKDATGSSIENISALEDVAARTGTSFDTVQSSLIKFNKALTDSKPGSEAEAVFKALGLSVQELKSLDPAEALLKVSQALSGFADDGDKARAAQILFGKSLKDVAPFLKDLAEKGALVAKITTQQAEEAEKFNKELFNMQKNAQDAARSLSIDLVTGLNAAAKAYRESGFVAGLDTLLFGDAGFKSDKKLFELTDALLDAENRLSAAKSGGSALDAALVRSASERVKSIKSQISALQSLRDISNPDNQSAAESRRLNRKPTLDVKVPDKAGGGSKTQSEKITDSQRALASYVKSLEATTEKTLGLSEAQKALDFLKGLGSDGEIPQVRELVLGLAAQVDKEKELAEALKLKRQLAIDAGDAITKSNEEYQALLGRLLAATPTANLEGQRKDVQLLTEEFSAGRISEELYLEAVAARLDLTGEKIKGTKSLAEDLGLSFTSAFEDAIVGGKGLQQVLSGLEQDIMRIVTRKLVTEPAGDAITGLLKNLGSSSSGGGSGGGIGAFLASFLPSFAVGTDYVPKDMIAQIHKGERIVPAAQNKGGMGGNSVNVTINQSFGQDTSRSTMLQAAADARRQLEYAGRNL